MLFVFCFSFFFNDTATTAIYTLSLHDALPIYPSKPPMKLKGTESSRMIGGFWAMCELKGEMMGTPYTGILTLGYDEEKKKYVGTWIDSMTGYLWTYTGSLDAGSKMLSLDTEGPGHDGKLCRFRETIEVKDKDH